MRPNRNRFACLEQNSPIQHRPVIVHHIVMLGSLGPVDEELVTIGEMARQFRLGARKCGNRRPRRPPTDRNDLCQPVADGPDEKLMPKVSIRPGEGPGCVGPQMVKQSAGIRGAYAPSPLPHDHVLHLVPAGIAVAGSAARQFIVTHRA